jgi:hypothetical protein
VSDYLTRDDLLAMGLDPEEADAVLAASPITGIGGEPVVEAAMLSDLLGLVADADDDDCKLEGPPA